MQTFEIVDEELDPTSMASVLDEFEFALTPPLSPTTAMSVTFHQLEREEYGYLPELVAAELCRVNEDEKVEAVVVARENRQPVLYLTLEGAPAAGYFYQAAANPRAIDLSIVDDIPAFPTEKHPLRADPDSLQTVRVAWQPLPNARQVPADTQGQNAD